MSLPERERVVAATLMATTFKPDLMTNDRLEAGAKGWGSLAIAVLCAANAVAEEILRGIDIKISDAEAPTIPLDDVLEKAIKAAMEAGAAPENAALIAAALCYFAGSGARAGVPMANRKLGAMARIKVGLPRGGGITLVTNKFSNRLTAYPAYKAVYEALLEKKLTKVDGAKLPPFVSGGSPYGHSVLGEDVAFPEIAYNAAKIGTEAMLRAFEGAGITPSPLWAALIGATVALEIVHPDAFLGEEYGPFGTVDSAYMAGKGAMEAAKLPPKLHIRGTDEELDTARVIGDFGLIFKDLPAFTVVGAMALNEIFAGLKEAVMIGGGFSGGPVNPPLGHLCGDAVPAIKLLMKYKGDVHKVAEEIRKYKEESFFDPEMALCAANTIARKAEEVRRGPVTRAMIIAGEPVRDAAIYRRAIKVYEMLKAGKSIEEAAKALDEERRELVEKRGSEFFSKMLGKKVEIKFIELRPQARRHDPFTKKYWGFDSYVSYEITIGEKKYKIENLFAKAIPEYVLKGVGREDPDYMWALTIGSVLAQELAYIGHTVINVTVPAAVAACLGMDPKEAAKRAENGAYLTRAIPGAKYRAEEVARLAKQIYERISKVATP